MARDWGVEVVAIPDQPGSLDGLDQTIEFLVGAGVPFRIDPILEPIGFGFAASLERYFEVRRRYPGAAMMMGVGNLTELTDVDSAGVNTILAGLCQELKNPERADDGRDQLGAVVGARARSGAPAGSSCGRRTTRCPSTSSPVWSPCATPRSLISARDNLAELQRRIRDPNWRIFAESGMIYALNNAQVSPRSRSVCPLRANGRRRRPRMRFTSGTS